MQRGFIVPFLIMFVGLAAIGAVLYYYSRDTVIVPVNIGVTPQMRAELADLYPERPKTLAEARASVSRETAELSDLISRSRAEGSIISSLQKEYSKVVALVTKTDPVVNKQKSAATANIDIKRQEINDILSSWNAMLASVTSPTATSSKITLAELIDTAKKDVEFIQTYIHELKDLVNGLPANDPYQIIVNNAIAEADKAMQTMLAIENSANSPQPTSAPTNPTIVTPAEIKAQEAVVDQVKIIEIKFQTEIQTQIDPNTIEGWQPVEEVAPLELPRLIEGENTN